MALATIVTSFRIRPIASGDLEAVARLHVEAFPHSALSIAGPRVVERYYRSQLDTHTVVHMPGAWATDELVGFACAGLLGDALASFLGRNRGLIAAEMLKRPWTVFSPVLWRRVPTALRVTAQRMLRRRAAAAGDADVPPYRLLAIATDTRWRGRGVAAAILRDVEEHAARVGEPALGLTVEPDNERAVALYEHRGYQRVRVGGVWRGAMRKALPPGPK